MDSAIRTVLTAHGKIEGDVAALADDANLYEAGLTSHASVNVMLALEDEFDIEFPDSLLRKSTFGSIAAIKEALEEIGVE